MASKPVNSRFVADKDSIVMHGYRRSRDETSFTNLGATRTIIQYGPKGVEVSRVVTDLSDSPEYLAWLAEQGC